VLVHDLLCSKGGIGAGSGPIKDAILRHKTRLKADFVKVELHNHKMATQQNGKGICEMGDLTLAFVPRWVRINRLKTTMEEFINAPALVDFQLAFELKDLELMKTGYFVDPNIPNLLAFSPHHPIQSTFEKEYTTGTIILQDKASCIPVLLLDPPWGARVLDACAAPGNKTTQLSAAVGPTGNVVAVERDQKRVETLRHMVERAGARRCISPSYAHLFLMTQSLRLSMPISPKLTP
jgi:25S rRNA (cytosine2278-C5)-methyltransferase